jgi:hypothetical protein
MIAVFLLAAAQSACGGIAVSPLQQWITVGPGKEAFFTITVTNTIRGTQTLPQTVSVESVDFGINPQGSISFGSQFAHPRSALKLITLEDESGRVILEPGQSKQIKGKVSAPLNGDGDYWGAIMIKILSPQKDAKGVAINLQTASGVFIHVPRRNYAAKGMISDVNVMLPDFANSNEPNKKDVKIEDIAMQIRAELKNDGITAFLGNGKAYLYTGAMKRFAAIQLHAMRRQIFPGQSRIFSGVLSDALAPGEYKMRVVFEAVSQHNDEDIAAVGRTIIKNYEFTVEPATAQKWSNKTASHASGHLSYEPKEIKLVLVAGRFTSVSVLVENAGLSTTSLRTHFEKSPITDWFSSESELTTFGPNMKRNIVFSLNIPKEIQTGDYHGTLIFEAERSGVSGKDITETMKIPILITISK